MEQLGALLDGSLSPVDATRAQCEAQLTALLRSPGFALQLCEFVFSPAVVGAPAHCQLACILLKKLVTSHWTLGAEDDEEEEAQASEVPYVVPDAEKAQVRQAIVANVQRVEVLQAFQESKLQTALCMAMAVIFERDWPEQWPELLPAIVAMLSGSERLAIEFSIRFLALASNHFSVGNCCELVTVLFPQLERVFIAKDDFSASVRTRIVRIVESSLVMVSMEANVGNATAQQLLQSNVAQWIGLQLAELPRPATNVKEYAIKIQILHTLRKFVEEWPKEMSELLTKIIPELYAMLVREFDAYNRDIVLSGEEEEDAYDSDGEGMHIGRSAVIVASLELVRSTLQAPTKSTRHLLVSGLRDFVFVMIGYMQITASQMETWQDDPNKYIADEDDDSLAYNVRSAATDLLGEIETMLGRKGVVASVEAAQQRLQSGDANWRLQEASLVVIGSLSGALIAAARKNDAELAKVLDLAAFSQTLFQVMNASAETLYLRARALWCASKFVEGMTPDMLAALLQVSQSGLDQQQVVPVRLYSCRAIGAIVRQGAGKQALQASSLVVVERLIQLADLSSEETLHIALETLVVVLQEMDTIAPQAAQASVHCFLAHWCKHLNDPLLSELIDSALAAVLESEELPVVANVHEQVLPVVRDMLVQSQTELSGAGNGLNIAASAITVLTTVIKHSFVAASAATADPAMAAAIVQQVFEPLVAILNVVDDEKVLNGGAKCLKWLVMFAVDSLSQYVCANGMNGMDATLNVASKLLSPAVDEASAVCVGGLITQILLKMGATLPTTTIQSILNAVGTKLATAEALALVESLCMVFARLVHTHGVELLNVLESLPPPPVSHKTDDTTPAFANMLAFVFTTWIEKQPEFYKLYHLKITVSALLKVAEWNDPRVMQLVVTGSEIESAAAQASGSGMQTRSKARTMPAAQKQFTRVHFLTKLMIVLANVMGHLGDEEEEWEDSDDEESGDEQDDQPSATGGASSSIFAPAEQYELLSDRLDANAQAAVPDEEADEEELEAHLDPLNDVDLSVLIPSTLQSVNADASLVQAMMPELTPADKDILSAVVNMQ